jgi:hypothetical protein
MSEQHNPWLIDGVISRTKDMAKELGLRIEPGSYNNIEIMADNPPYGKNVMLAKLNDWETANLYLQGYRQGKLEMTALAKGKK